MKYRFVNYISSFVLLRKTCHDIHLHTQAPSVFDENVISIPTVFPHEQTVGI